jgi:hypothetical protein
MHEVKVEQRCYQMPGTGSICFADSLDAATFIRFAASGGSPIVMNIIFRRLAPALVVLIFSCFALGDDFKSKVVNAGDTQALPRVHNGQFMVIRNFTQENGSSMDRGVVQVSMDGGATFVTVLSAAFVDTTTNPPDVINNIIIAGPADVQVTCGTGAGNCFISFKKDGN